jgi:hypothetical protein
MGAAVSAETLVSLRQTTQLCFSEEQCSQSQPGERRAQIRLKYKEELM